MSAEKSTEKRRYRDDVKEITLMAFIPSPADGISREGYGHEHFRFFIEGGMFCIESRKTGRIEEVPPTMVKRMRRFTADELKAKEERAP